jgi:hypothetical protein
MSPQAVKKDDTPPFQKLFQILGGCAFSGSLPQLRADCPWCAENSFYANVETGQYECKRKNNCGKQGNAYTFIRDVYATALAATTKEDRKALHEKRGLPYQTLERHGVAWFPLTSEYLLPYKSEEGNIDTLQRYNVETGAKLALPGFCTQLYGRHELSDDRSKHLIVTEGAWDCIAVGQQLTALKRRKERDILGAHSAGTFKPECLKYFRDRKVDLAYDNDKAGSDGMERVAKMVRDNKVSCDLRVMKWPPGSSEGCDLSDLVRAGESVIAFLNANCVKQARERAITFLRADAVSGEKIDWIWNGHIRRATFVSLSGLMGTMKSLIAKDFAGRVSAGRPMPDGTPGNAAAGVLYLTSEDSASNVADLRRASH